MSGDEDASINKLRLGSATDLSATTRNHVSLQCSTAPPPLYQLPMLLLNQ